MELRPRQFERPEAYLDALFQALKRRNPSYSLRAWARQLGLANAGVLSRVLSGKRPLTPKLFERLATSLGLPAEDRADLEILMAASKSPEAAREALVAKVRAPAVASAMAPNLGVDRFRAVSDWHHLAILEMMALKGASSDPRALARRLGGGITPTQAQQAVQRLERLGLVEKDKAGRLRRVPGASLVTGYQGSNDAVRAFHAQMIEKALHALKYEGLDTRSISGSTVSVDEHGFAKIKAILADAHRQILALGLSTGARATYQISTQAFLLAQAEAAPGTNSKTKGTPS